MLRSLTTRKSPHAYEQLRDEAPLFDPKLSRSTSASSAKSGVFSSSKKDTPAKKAAEKASKIHPIFSLFDTRKRNKATARPEFSRYMEYLKEGGFGGVIDMAAAAKPTMPAK